MQRDAGAGDTLMTAPPAAQSPRVRDGCGPVPGLPQTRTWLLHQAAARPGRARARMRTKYELRGGGRGERRSSDPVLPGASSSRAPAGAICWHPPCFISP